MFGGMNLKQLAKHLNLSQTTVSRALNGYPEVSAETRRRVDDAARKARPIPTSSLSLHGLVRHMAEVERNWFRRALLCDHELAGRCINEAVVINGIGRGKAGRDRVGIRPGGYGG